MCLHSYPVMSNHLSEALFILHDFGKTEREHKLLSHPLLLTCLVLTTIMPLKGKFHFKNLVLNNINNIFKASL